MKANTPNRQKDRQKEVKVNSREATTDVRRLHHMQI